MLERLREVFVRPIARRWLHTSNESWRALPVPTDSPSVRVSGSDPDRLLLIGSGLAVGYGVTSHELALAGNLARQLSEKSGRGAEIDVVAAHSMTSAMAIAHLDSARLRAIDAVVITPGSLETLLLLPIPVWRRELQLVLDHVRRVAPASVHVFIVAVPPMAQIVSPPWLLGVMAGVSVRLLNRELSEICSTTEFATYVPFAPTEKADRTGRGRSYQRWAALISPTISETLETQNAAR